MTQANANTNLIYQVVGLNELQQLVNIVNQLQSAHMSLAQTMNGFNASVSRVTSGITKWTNAGDKLTIVKTKLNGQLVETQTYLDQTAKKTDTLSNATGILHTRYSLLSRIVIGSLIARSIGLITSGLAGSVDKAAEFEQRISEIRTISQATQLAFGTWANEVKRISDAYGKPLLDVAEAVYQTLSNQVAKGKEAIQFVETASRLSQVAVSSTAAAVNTLSSAINAFGLSNQSAERLSAQFFKAVDLGRFRLEDLENIYGRVAMVTGQLKIKNEELLASLTMITRQGVTASQAETMMNMVLTALLKPTEALKRVFKEWGVETGEEAIQAFGLIGVFNKLNEAVTKHGSALGELATILNRVRALTGGTALIMRPGEYTKEVKQLTQSAEEYEKAQKIITESAGYQWRKMVTELSNLFTTYGQKIMETIVNLNNGVVKLTTVIDVAAQTVIIFGKAFILLETLNAVSLIFRLAQGYRAVASGATAAAVASTAASKASALGPIAGGLLLGNEIGQLINSYLNERKADINTLGNNEVEMAKRVYAEKSQLDLQLLEKRLNDQALLAENEARLTNLRNAEIQADVNSFAESRDTGIELQKKIRELELDGMSDREKELYLTKEMGDSEKRIEQYLKSSNGHDKESVESAKLLNKELANYMRMRNELKAAERSYEKQGSGVSKTQLYMKGRDGEKDPYEGQYIIENPIDKKADATRRADQRTKELTKSMIDLLKAQVEQTNQLRTNLEFEKRFEEAKVKQKLAIDNVTKSIEAQGKSLIELEAKKEKYTANLGGELTRAGKLRNFDMENIPLLSSDEDKEEWRAAKKFAARLNELKAELQTAMQTAADQGVKFDPEPYRALIREFAEGILKFKGIKSQGADDFAQRILGYQAALDMIKQQAFNVNQKVENLQTLQGTLEGIQAFALIQASAMNQKVKDSAEQLINVIKASENAALQMEAAVKRVQSGKAAMEAIPFTSGGRVSRFATGGSVGSDTVPAMLSPGEFVMNRMAARMFHPALVAMNSGARYNTGGNVSVGDVNITVQGGNNSEVTVRQIGDKLRREIRRGTIRLN